MHAASGGHTSFQNIQKSKLFENLNDAYMYIDAYVCNLEIKLRWNELLCSQEIVNRHFERKECFSAASCKVLQSFARISHGSESSVFVERRRQNYRMSVASLTSRFANSLTYWDDSLTCSVPSWWPIAEIQNLICFPKCYHIWFLNLFKKFGNLKFGNFPPLRMITASCWKDKGCFGNRSPRPQVNSPTG